MAKFDQMGTPPGHETSDGSFWVLLTGKNINATDGSRTAINADIAVGDVVVADPYKQDVPAEARNNVVCVTRPQSSHLDGPIYVVEFAGKDVNESFPGGLSNERRGGWILVRKIAGEVRATVPDSTAVGGYLVPADGNYKLAAVGATGVASIAAINTHKFRALEANSSGAAAIRRVELKSA